MSRAARVMLRLVLVAAGLAAAVRAALYLAYAWYQARTPIEAYHLEPKMTYLAWRVREGLSLYPPWDDLPNYEANFFGPLYFLLVGHLGRFFGDDLQALQLIGRLVSIASGLLAALLVGVAAYRRYGRGAGPVAALQSLGAAPMAGFGVMVRPDLLADTLGFAGFLLAVGQPGRRGWRVFAGGGLLAAAVLTKQTTGLYLPAAALALAFVGRRREALGLFLGVIVALGSIAGLITLTVEPRFLADFLGEGRSPTAPADWARNLGRLWFLAADLPIWSVVGLFLWFSRPFRDAPLACLTIVLWTGALVTSLKVGADLNYFLGPRLVATLGFAAAWGGAWDLTTPKSKATAGRIFLVTMGLLAFNAFGAYGLRHALIQARMARDFDRINGPGGRVALSIHRDLFRVAAEPSRGLLTDCGYLALRQEGRAPFVDPWLFRMRVENGLLDASSLARELESGSYGVLATTHDLFAPTFDTMSFSLPPPVARAARSRYRFVGMVGGLYLYQPSPPP